MDRSTLPLPIVAGTDDLPAAVAAALSDARLPDPTSDHATRVSAGGIPFAMIEWGDPAAEPILLIHGVTSSVETWWRVGPALAATGRRVVALDLPGHGRTGHWNGHHRFREAAEDVRAFVLAAGLDRPDLRVVGHSFGAMAAAALPVSGFRPARLVLMDPPAAPEAGMRAMAEDPVERHYPDLDEGIRVVGVAFPSWTYGDVVAKAVGLHRVEQAAALAILLENGDWDAGVADLAAASGPGATGPGATGPGATGPGATGPGTTDSDLPPTWVVRGDPAAGGLTFDGALPSLAALLGPDRILTIAGAPHSPQRTHPEATVLALITALGLGG